MDLREFHVSEGAQQRIRCRFHEVIGQLLTEPKKEPASKAVPIILKAMVGIENDDGWAVLGGVGSRIPNIAPDFDPRTYGHNKLSTLVEKSGGFEMERFDGTGLMIKPKNPKKKAAAK